MRHVTRVLLLFCIASHRNKNEARIGTSEGVSPTPIFEIQARNLAPIFSLSSLLHGTEEASIEINNMVNWIEVAPLRLRMHPASKNKWTASSVLLYHTVVEK